MGAIRWCTVGAARAEVGLPLVSVFCFCFCLIADHCARLKETYSLYYRGREHRRMTTTAWNKSMEQNAKSNTSTSKPKLWIQPYMKMYILQPNCAIFPPIWNEQVLQSIRHFSSGENFPPQRIWSSLQRVVGHCTLFQFTNDNPKDNQSLPSSSKSWKSSSLLWMMGKELVRWTILGQVVKIARWGKTWNGITDMRPRHTLYYIIIHCALHYHTLYYIIIHSARHYHTIFTILWFTVHFIMTPRNWLQVMY